MTALVIEGVSLQDLDDMPAAPCAADEWLAVATISHTGCPGPVLLCTAHAVTIQAALHESGDWEWDCPACERTDIPAGDFVVRPA